MGRSWDLSPESSTEEAVAWFRARTPLGAREFSALSDYAKRTGFWMSSVTTKQRAARIQLSLDRAIADGISFEDWRSSNAGKLRRISPAHLETTFMNWATSTLNASRVQYLMDPQVVRRRPYWMYDSVMDQDTTDICVACNETVLPAGHRWMLSHTPPLHHRCRGVIRGLTTRAANRIGVRQRAPRARKTQPADGFGRHVIEPWEPSASDLPAGYKPKRRPRP